MEFKQVPLTTPLTADTKDSIELFLYRAVELIENYNDLKKKGVSFEGVSNYSFEGGMISGPSLNVCRHRLKGLFVDFRFFFGNDEPTNFLNFTGVLGRLSEDIGFRSVLKESKLSWKAKGMLDGWSQISALEMIRIYFNSQAFHGRHVNESEYLKLIKSFDQKTLEYVLAFYISDRIQCIKNISWVLEKVCNDNVLQVPSYKYA
ncbi:hypothetical protein AB6E04_22010 [Vibrio amylolyticus]|uniref:hypothetical protein n=1 Tax=Vibrio amylolyticus TaxID=2847292 RepID=UPI00354CC1FF